MCVCVCVCVCGVCGVWCVVCVCVVCVVCGVWCVWCVWCVVCECVLDREGSSVFASTALVVWTTVYLTGYSDCLVSVNCFHDLMDVTPVWKKSSMITDHRPLLSVY